MSRPLRPRLRLAALAACASAAALAAAAPAKADPSLWVAKSKGSIVYLFGTEHLLPPDLTWRRPGIDKALKDSAELWLEVPLPVSPAGSKEVAKRDDLPRIQALIASLGMDPQTKLSALLSAEQWSQLTALAAAARVPPAALEHMRPWLAATVLTEALTAKIGWTAEAGADVILDREALAEGKPVKGFETAEGQLRAFAEMTPEGQLAYLRQTLDEAEGGEGRVRRLASNWAAGDDAAIAAETIKTLQTHYPELYRRLVVARNHAWLPQIEQLMKTPGVRLVAVGDGHLVGPDGLLALLKADGVRLQRVR